jgi:hypothetical protein
MLKGSCLCGGVRYEVEGPFEIMAYCHCVQCRKASGSVSVVSKVIQGFGPCCTSLLTASRAGPRSATTCLNFPKGLRPRSASSLLRRIRLHGFHTGRAT